MTKRNTPAYAGIAVHRFHASVAVALPETTAPTYLSRHDAIALANALRDCAHDIEDHPIFAESKFAAREWNPTE